MRDAITQLKGPLQVVSAIVGIVTPLVGLLSGASVRDAAQGALFYLGCAYIPMALAAGGPFGFGAAAYEGIASPTSRNVVLVAGAAGFVAGLVLYPSLEPHCILCTFPGNRTPESHYVLLWLTGAGVIGLCGTIVQAARAYLSGEGSLFRQNILCPYCAEAVRPEATKCRHCGEWLE
jgi:hypothetical protein